MKRNIQYC